MNTTTNIAIANLHPFEGHPYQVRDDAEMDALVESVRELGILPKGTTYKPNSPFLREELRKLDQYDRETRFLGETGIETMD